MSEDETMHGTAQPDAGLTEEYPTIASGLMTPEGASGDLSLEGDDDDEWPVRGPAKGVRLALPTAGIVVVLLVAAGFWGGAVIEKNHGSSSGSGAASALAARFRSAQTATTAGTGTAGTGAPSFASGGFTGGGFGGASSSAAIGTVSVVSGKTLYILTSSGSLVKVTLGASTTITRNATAQAVGLRPGDTVVVQGATGKSGDVTATSISATAPGVTATG
jgi:hypothetical protein